MDALAFARALHVLAVVHWIGGVALVTLVILPAVAAHAEPAERLALFEAVEGRFAAQARVSVTLAGATGLYMTWALDLWQRFADPAYWWMHAMTAVWALFTLVLFVAEPLVLHDWFRRRAMRDPEGAFRLVARGHRVLLALSALAIGGAVYGVHGPGF